MESQFATPALLLAMPQMQDPNFARSVVLLCRQEEGEGSMGLILNRQTGTLASSIVELDPPIEEDSELEVWIGGPVEPERGWLLLDHSPDDEQVTPIGAGLYLSASVDILRQLLEHDPQPTRRGRFLLGYAGWGEGQLEAELAASSWLTIAPSPEIIFDVPADQMWEYAIRSLGVNPYTLQMGGGVH